MATEILNIHDYSGYIKCGEILKSPLPTYQYPFILKCYQCDAINFVLESFIIHIQEHCNYNDVLRKNIDIKISNESETEVENENEPIENPIVKIETITMDVDDPLIVIKDEIIDENTSQEAETYNNTKEENDNIDEYSSNSDENFNSDDDDTGSEEETNKKAKKKRKSALPPTVGKFIKSKQNMKILIELYKNQPNLWNKDLPFYRFRDKRQGFLEETTKDLNNKLDSQYTWKEVSDIISYIYRKHRDDFKRLRLYEEEDKNSSKDTKYKRCWFFDDLYFLRPKPVIQLQKLDTNLPDLTPEEVIQIIQIYREFPHLWNSNLIEFICSNKRHEAQIEMLKSLETNMNINISETALEEYLRTLHYYFSREKRLRQKNVESNSKNLAVDYYEHLMYLYDHEGPFSCNECNRSFSKPLGFKVHKSNHDDSVPFICSQCNKEFKTIQSYTVHAKRHFEDLEFVCNVCNRKFVTYADLRVHLLTHSGDRPYCCEICGTSYRHIQCFKRHQRRHEKRYTHTCHICSKGYYSKDRYDDHMNSHMNIRQHICQLCGKGFITSRALKTHSVTHEDARNHACKLCGKTFKLKIGVLQHMRTHGSRVESEDKN